VVVEHKAFSSLLDITCDAVAELDMTGMIMSPSLKLASLLLLQGQSVEGSLLQRFIVSERDRQLFDEGLTTDGPRLLCVEMRDSMGSLIKVELYHVPFKSAENKTRFLVGVKEYTADTVPEIGGSRTVMPIAPQMSNRSDNTTDSADSFSEGDTQDSLCTNASGQGADVDTPTDTPSHRLTSNQAMDVTLLTTMASWKFRLRQQKCCSFHEGISVLRHSVHRLARMRCNVNLGQAETDWQCTDCGILDEDYRDENNSCFICANIEKHFPAIREEPLSHGRKGRTGGRLPKEEPPRVWSETDVQAPRPLKIGQPGRIAKLFVARFANDPDTASLPDSAYRGLTVGRQTTRMEL
jgi:hypothetical protein